MKPDRRAIWRKKHPWARFVEYARRRCACRDRKQWYPFYEAKGIKVRLNASDLGIIWKRDKAYLLKKPSLDRVYSNGDYEPCNVRFIEFKLNSRMAWDPALRDGHDEIAPVFT